GRKIRRHVVLESPFTDEPQQFLQPWYTYDSRSSERFQRIVGKLAFAHIAAHFPFAVIGRKPREAHRPALHVAHAGPEGVLLAHRSRYDFLKVHAHIFEKMFRQVAAVEAD